MTRFLLHHRHEPDECRVVFAAWKGFQSPLRRRAALGSCPSGGHDIWWEVCAADEREALATLPNYVARRTVATPIAEIEIP